jgi:hypothetical protein
MIPMKQYRGVLLLGVSLLGGAALAQSAPPAKQVASAGKSVREIVAALGKSSGVAVLIDSSLLGEKTTFKDTEATPETLEAALDKLVKTLPTGTAWAKVYLPEPPAGKKYTGDAVAQFILAQATLFGKAGASEPGKIELLGKALPTEQLQPLIADLKLKPYYVLRNSQRPKFVAGTPGMGAAVMDRLGGPGGFMGALLKQLNVSSIDQVQPGTYKVTLPGPDGNPMNAEVTVEGDESQRRVMVHMKDGG